MNLLRNFLALMTATASIAAVAQIPGSGQWNSQNYVNWRTIKTGQTSRIHQRGMTVLDNENAFVAYWNKLTGSPAETAPTQNIDWTRNRVVAITLGDRNTGGYNVAVKGISKDNGGIATIKAVEETPIRGQYVSQVITAPWALVQVDRGAADFRVEWSSREAQANVVLGPGGVYIGPRDQSGAGWVPPGSQASWSTFRSGTQSNIDDQQTIVMSTEWDFQAYFQHAFGGRAPSSGNDWLQYRLVAIHLGKRPTSGYGISVKNVIKNGGSATIRATELLPIPGTRVYREASRPWVIIRVESRIVDFSVDIQPDQTSKKIIVEGGG
jgi:hypothetical protein